MQYDLLDDAPPLAEMFSFSDTPRRLPKRVHVSQVYRWHQKGLRGVKLRALRIGGGLYTHERWLLEFFERLSGGEPRPASRTPSRRRRRATERAESELERAGL